TSFAHFDQGKPPAPRRGPVWRARRASASFSETLLKSAKLFAIGKKIPQTGANQGGLHPGALAPPIWRRPTRLAEPEETARSRNEHEGEPRSRARAAAGQGLALPAWRIRLRARHRMSHPPQQLLGQPATLFAARRRGGGAPARSGQHQRHPHQWHPPDWRAPADARRSDSDRPARL